MGDKVLKQLKQWGTEGGGLLLLLLLLIAIFSWQPTTQPEISGSETPESGAAYLPLAQKQPTLTPTPTPTPMPTPTYPASEAAVLVQISPNQPINASTFNSGSFIIQNLADNPHHITKVRFDLSTAVFPDMVFDPNGGAGDHVAKDVTIDEADGGVRYAGRSYFSEHDLGFDILELNFDDFPPGQQLTFSVDVDPTSIRATGSPGPGESGSVSGLELAGTTVTVTFENGLVLSGKTHTIAGSNSGSERLLRQNGLPAPLVEVVNVTETPVVVSEVNQVVRVYATEWQTVHLVQIEGGLFTEGQPSGGFDIDPFEVNNALYVAQTAVSGNSTGYVDIPIALQRSRSEGGRNVIAVVIADVYGFKGETTNPIILELKE